MKEEKLSKFIVVYKAVSHFVVLPHCKDVITSLSWVYGKDEDNKRFYIPSRNIVSIREE